MPIDTSIYNQIQQPKLDNPLNALAQVAQLQHFQSQNKLADLTYGEKQREIEQTNALNGVYKGAIGPDGTIDRTKLYTGVAGVAGTKLPGIQKGFADADKAAADALKIRLENGLKQFEATAQIMSGVKDQASFDQAKQQITAIVGPEHAANIPAVYDPAVIEQGRLKAMSVKDQMEQKLKEITQTETSRHNKATEGLTLSGQKQTERHFQANQSAPQYMETDAGLVALPKKLAPGQVPTGTPVMGTNGEALGKPLKAIPPSVNTAIINNNQSLNQIDRALTLLSGNNVGDPTAGGMQGDTNATGFKGYLPNGILNRVDPKGVATRAEISDIGSLKIHDRSGAAVTVSESPRLMPFVPLATDDAATAAKKLTRLKLELQNESNALTETYSKGQGYKPSPVSRGNHSAPAGVPADIAELLKKHGG